MELLITIIGVICLLPVLLTYTTLSRGFIISKLYLWFILSIFPNLPHFTILQFIGFCLFLSLITSQGSSTPIKKEYKDETLGYISMIFAPWMVLLFAYIIHLFY